MRKKLIILANTEKLCAYLLTSDAPLQSQPHIEHIKTHLHQLSPDPSEISDDDGRFPSGNLRHGAPMRHGESHGRTLEKKKRLLDAMATAICDVIDHEQFDIWNLAASADLAGQLVDRLPIHAQNKLTDLKKADYTGLPIKEIKSIFS